MASTSDRDPLSFLRVRLEEAAERSDRRGIPCFLGFLTPEERAYAEDAVKRFPGRVAFFGGYEEAERCIAGFFPEYADFSVSDFPLVTVAFTYRKTAGITHRDVLGSLMSVGIKRESVGDILCSEGISVVFLRKKIADFVQSQLQKIGGEGVTVISDYTGPLPVAHTLLPMRETIASPRLDVIVKTLVGCSREEASRLIVAGNVSVDHKAAESVSVPVKAPATVSVRGYGRYRIDQIGPETKKGRLVLLACRYQ